LSVESAQIYESKRMEDDLTSKPGDAGSVLLFSTFCTENNSLLGVNLDSLPACGTISNEIYLRVTLSIHICSIMLEKVAVDGPPLLRTSPLRVSAVFR